MLYVIEQSIYPYKIWVCDDKETIKSKFQSNYTFEFSEASNMRTFDNVGLDGKIGALIWINKNSVKKLSRNSVLSIIAHEAIHATNMMFSYLGITYTLQDDEHFAYFVEFITFNILEMLYPNRKKK